MSHPTQAAPPRGVILKVHRNSIRIPTLNQVQRVTKRSLTRAALSKLGLGIKTCSLDTSQADCRLLFLPGEPDYFHIPGAKWAILRPISTPAGLNNNIPDMRCAAIRETVAQHSDYAKQVIVVKAFKKDSGYDVVTRGQSWDHEREAHSGLQSKIDGKDLCDQSWCDYSAGKTFRGTLDNAQRVLYNMARALQYLRGQKILDNDIKSRNIMFNGTKAVLIDVEHATRDGSGACTGGTPWYVPPEYLNLKERKAPSDVGVLGIVMLFALPWINLPDAGIDVPCWQIKELWSTLRDNGLARSAFATNLLGTAKKCYRFNWVR
ncbi:hypothetical protein FHL15_007991 [Xylaria flabelliformis]|uniref:Protein kinase domain-containing protein n=1 Tax=Xylaria flabelliformis TaxID=2512241 RepID=A0A553HTC7_9PEZI|nr:hypothetical protein FHL15_007991 [Xylaria flabelliformis]